MLKRQGCLGIISNNRQRNLSLFAVVGNDDFGDIIVELHSSNPPKGNETFLGRYGIYWSLLKVKRRLLVTEYEMTFLKQNPPLKTKCVAGHKFADMLEKAIEKINN